MIYWKLPNNKSYVRIGRNGLTTAMGEAILESFYPDLYLQKMTPVESREEFIQAFNNTDGNLKKIQVPNEAIPVPAPGVVYYYSELKNELYAFVENKPPHVFMPTASETTRGTPHALIRHPVDRFRSFVSREVPELHMKNYEFNVFACTEDAVNKLRNTDANQPFSYKNRVLISQVDLLDNIFSGIQFYRYPDHVDELVNDLQLPIVPVKAPSTIVRPITFTPAQEAAIMNHYEKDLKLYSCITKPGIVLSPQGIVVKS
jgi:hypothetical protein